MLDWALAYAAMGWPVFPIHNLAGNKCTCSVEGCKHIAKHPRTKNGHNDATTSEAIIKGWWLKWPDANIGIATGPKAGFWVLDVDDKNDGPGSLRRWEAENETLPETVTSLTGGGGSHYLFKYPAEGKISSRQNIIPGVDVRGAGGYIVAPPSKHASGGVYEWGAGCEPNTEMITLNDDQVLRLGVVSPEIEAANVSDVLDKVPDDPEEKNKLFAALQILDVDDRDHWFKSGMALHSTGWDEGFDLWCAWSMQSSKFNISDSRRVWNSFKSDAGGLGLGSIYKLANQIDPTWSDGQELKFVVSPGSQADQVLNGITRQSDKLETFKVYDDWGEDNNAAPYLIRNLIPQRTLGYMFAPPKAKKTFAAIDLAAHIALGWDYCGNRVNKRKVLYISGEGNQSFFIRLRGWAKANGEDLRGRVNVLPQAIKVDRAEIQIRLFNTIAQINQKAETPEDQIGFVVLDTLARTMSGNENAQQDMNAYIEACDRMRDYFGVTTLIITHISKGEGRADTTRGSTVLPGAVDFGFKVTSEQGGADGKLLCQDVKDGAASGYDLAFDVVELGEDDEGEPVTTLAVSNRWRMDESAAIEEQKPKEKPKYYSNVDKYVIEIVQALNEPRLWLDVRPLVKARALVDNPNLNDKTFRNQLSKTIAKVSQKDLTTIRHDKDSGLIWDLFSHT